MYTRHSGYNVQCLFSCHIRVRYVLYDRILSIPGRWGHVNDQVPETHRRRRRFSGFECRPFVCSLSKLPRHHILLNEQQVILHKNKCKICSTSCLVVEMLNVNDQSHQRQFDLGKTSKGTWPWAPKMAPPVYHIDFISKTAPTQPIITLNFFNVFHGGQVENFAFKNCTTSQNFGCMSSYLDQ